MLGHFVQPWSPKYWCDNLGWRPSSFVQWLRQAKANYMTFWLLLCSEPWSPKSVSEVSSAMTITRHGTFGSTMEETAASHPSLSPSLTFDEWRGMRFHLDAPNKQSRSFMYQLFESEAKSELKPDETLIIVGKWRSSNTFWFIVYCSNKIAWNAQYCFYQLWANILQI